MWGGLVSACRRSAATLQQWAALSQALRSGTWTCWTQVGASCTNSHLNFEFILIVALRFWDETSWTRVGVILYTKKAQILEDTVTAPVELRSATRMCWARVVASCMNLNNQFCNEFLWYFMWELGTQEALVSHTWVGEICTAQAKEWGRWVWRGTRTWHSLPLQAVSMHPSISPPSPCHNLTQPLHNALCSGARGHPRRLCRPGGSSSGGGGCGGVHGIRRQQQRRQEEEKEEEGGGWWVRCSWLRGWLEGCCCCCCWQPLAALLLEQYNNILPPTSLVILHLLS